LDLEIILIGVAFVLGFGASRMGLPPLVGFLLAGFVLHLLGVESSDAVDRFSKLGVTLLLFTIGLKLEIATLLRREVWATTLVQVTATTGVAAAVLLGLGGLGLPLALTLDLPTALVLGFALCFSSTVFAIKTLDEKGESATRHGVTAVGILIVQDLLAVLFVVAMAASLPSLWALALLGLPLLRWPLGFVLDRLGHGEVMLLFGFAMALIGYALFESVGLKGDLGALVFGMLVGTHAKGDELAKALMGFKELFLVAFFLSIGMEGIPGPAGLVLAVIFVALAPAKGALFFGLLTRFGLRARTSHLAGLTLACYSEFGLIVAYYAKAAGWLPPEWMAVMGVTVALSFLVATPPNAASHRLWERMAGRLRRFERADPIDAPEPVPPAEAIVFGMGRVGSGAYDEMCTRFERAVVGVDVDPAVVAEQRSAGRRVIQGDATDPDFWSRCPGDVRVVLVAMSDHAANLYAVEEVNTGRGDAFVVVAARFPDEARELEAAGADRVLDFHAEAGTGLAEHAAEAVLGR
jgi:predicted Kef-type K+ transport protein